MTVVKDHVVFTPSSYLDVDRQWLVGQPVGLLEKSGELLRRRLDALVATRCDRNRIANIQRHVYATQQVSVTTYICFIQIQKCVSLIIFT